jgi:hypothetical protein
MILNPQTSLFILVMMLGSAPTEQQSSPSRITASSPDQIQSVHSKLHHQGLSGQIPEMLSQTTGDIELKTGRAPALTVEMDSANELANRACESDLIVVGITGKSTSHATADQGYIYTDWKFTVENVLKNNSKAPAKQGSQIVVTRPGGTLLINGRTVSAKREDFRNFGEGEELLLYLRFVPQTGAYLMSGPTGFVFGNGQTAGFGKRPLRPEFEAIDKTKMIDQVKASIATAGANPHCGGNNQ